MTDLNQPAGGRSAADTVRGASRHAPLSDHLLAIIQAQTEIAQAVREPLELMNLVVRHACALLHADGAAVGEVEGDHLKFIATSGRTVPLGIQVPIHSSISGECLRTRKVLVSNDTETDPRVDRASARAVNARSMAVAPLIDVQGALGVLNVTSRRTDAFGERETQTLQLISGLLGAALGNAHAFAEKTRAEAEARELAERLSAVLSAATANAIIGVDVDLKVRFFSVGAERMLGYHADEMIGRRPVMLHDPDELRRAVEEAGGSLSCAFLGNVQRGEAYTRDWTYIRKDGSRLSVTLTLTPMHNASGELTGYIGVATDITARKAVDRMKDEFISIVSHELRTPLTGIRASLGLLSSGLLGEVSARGQRMLEVAVANTDRLIRLVGDMLDLERMQSGEAAVHVRACDPDEVIRVAIDAMKPEADRAGIGLTLASGSSATVRADPDRLAQVLTNLLSNAIKFSDPGTSACIETRLVDDHRLQIGVRDQGRGIPSDQLERVFERFRQVDASDSREKGGTGLGLAICRMIVEQHGGHIWAERSVPTGTVVWFELPVVSQSPA